MKLPKLIEVVVADAEEDLEEMAEEMVVEKVNLVEKEEVTTKAQAKVLEEDVVKILVKKDKILKTLVEDVEEDNSLFNNIKKSTCFQRCFFFIHYTL
ncbi:hypothetical protein T190423A01A_30390 [Tenacibaculum sp. 190130A14a]|uniref:Uncharacterized protein n=1 Tax=Tenacibaculum polynesiense TaxID=3137857 RepID=A0ABM9PCP4_9FLAO